MFLGDAAIPERRALRRPFFNQTTPASSISRVSFHTL
jgi:hypothetical protein